MEGSISLGRAEGKRLLELYRRHPDPAVRKRGHMVLLLADGHPWSLIVTVLYCSTRTIARWKERYEAGGLEALFGERRGRASPGWDWRLARQ